MIIDTPELEPVVSLQCVSMEYPPAISDRVSAFRPRTWKAQVTPSLALDSVNFTAYPGERVGIIGPNGAGKTTLLRIISGVYRPTSGTASVHGSVTQLLDSGFGLVPDLSGTTNARTYGVLHGLRGPLLDDYVQKAITFAEIGDAIFRPVSTYSTGMVMRLVFALSTSIEPDVLVLDEALATGDAEFQEKAKQRLRSFLSQAGVVVVSSHSEDFIKEICTRVLVLSRGVVIFNGETTRALDFYRTGL